MMDILENKHDIKDRIDVEIAPGLFDEAEGGSRDLRGVARRTASGHRQRRGADVSPQ